MIVFMAIMSCQQISQLEFDMSTLISVTIGLLGLDGLRTFEKMKGIAKLNTKFPTAHPALINAPRNFTFQ